MNGRYLMDIVIVPLDMDYQEWVLKNQLWKIRTLIGLKEKKKFNRDLTKTVNQLKLLSVH